MIGDAESLSPGLVCGSEIQLRQKILSNDGTSYSQALISLSATSRESLLNHLLKHPDTAVTYGQHIRSTIARDQQRDSEHRNNIWSATESDLTACTWQI